MRQASGSKEDEMKTRTIMRRGVFLGAALALAGGTLAAGAALAEVPAKFVVTGDAAKKILEDHEINVATAEKIGKACIDAATKQGVAVTVVILNPFGQEVYYYRMDGQGYTNTYTAGLKAKTALITRAPTHRLANATANDTWNMVRTENMGFFPTAGGLPIIVNDVLIGAIGVGGSAPKPPVWSDEICAQKALEEVIGPQPPLLADVRHTAPGAAGGGGGARGNGAPAQ
jgi:uncharacterized protein GlcG (DUF336 family)